jgi:hypothetical protein
LTSYASSYASVTFSSSKIDTETGIVLPFFRRKAVQVKVIKLHVGF